MTTNAVALRESLEAAARTFDGPSELSFLSDHLVRGHDDEPLFAPYIALVGPEYVAGGSTLLLATAQNLAQFNGRPNDPRWLPAIGQPGDPIWRLYGGAPTAVYRSFCAVPIQPWADGVLVALAGVLALARGEDAPERLEDIARRTAVTNFFKHSLHQAGRRDLNPLARGVAGWTEEIRQKYLGLTYAGLVAPELKILEPRDIITFRHLPEAKLRAASGAKVWTVNDPAWIKRGMGGATKTGSDWRRRAEGVPKDVADRIDGWVRQMASPYSAGKAEATRLYLAKYYCEWSADPRTQSSVRS